MVAKVRRLSLEACMTCPLCNKLLRDATTISLCLHTFCRKCIYKKLSEEEMDCCPVCNIVLGFLPVEKLRPDHSLQDIRAKIFPFKRKKIKAQEVVPSISLPTKRKERPVSSLVVSAPKISKHTGFMGKRTKIGTREAASLHGCNFILEEPIETEETYGENNLDSSTAEPSKKHRLNEDKENSMDLTEAKVDQDGTVKKLNLASEAETLSEGGETTLSTSPILPAEKQKEQEKMSSAVTIRNLCLAQKKARASGIANAPRYGSPKIQIQTHTNVPSRSEQRPQEDPGSKRWRPEKTPMEGSFAPNSCWVEDFSALDEAIFSEGDDAFLKSLSVPELQSLCSNLKKWCLRGASIAFFLEKHSSEFCRMFTLDAELKSLQDDKTALSKRIEDLEAEHKKIVDDKDKKIRHQKKRIEALEKSESGLKKQVKKLEAEVATITQQWTEAMPLAFQNAVEQLKVLNPEGLVLEGLDPVKTVIDGRIVEVPNEDVNPNGEQVVENTGDAA